MEAILIAYLLVIAVMIASLWKIFEKAGEPGWAALVPFYNMYLLTTSVAGKEALWFFLLFIPFVNIIIVFMIYIGVAERFGKGAAFGIGLIFLPFIFFPMLAFGDAEHDSQQRSRRRSRGRDYGDYDDDDDRPRKKKKPSRYDDDEEDRPARRSRREEVDEDEEEEERPRKRRRVEEDDDEDDRPRRSRRRDVDD